MTQKQTLIIPVILLVIFGIATRLLPHPANVTAIGAVALFSGFYLPKRFAYLLPLATMFVSDLIIGWYSLPIMLTVYAAFMLSVFLGFHARANEHRFVALGASTLIGSLAFFFLTNAAVWAFGTMYPHTLSGLGASYVMAIPFFRSSLIGDIVFTTLLVGNMEAVTIFAKRKTIATSTTI